MKATEMETTQKQNLSRKSRGTLTVKWAGSRDKIFSPSGRGRTFFLTSLFIELIEGARELLSPCSAQLTTQARRSSSKERPLSDYCFGRDSGGTSPDRR